MQFDPGLEYQPNRGERDDNSWLMYCNVFTDGPYSFLWTSYLKSNSRSDYVICISAFAFASKPAACCRPFINSALLLYLAGRVTPSGVDVRLKNASSDTVTRFITSKHLHIPLWHRNLEYIIFFIIGGDGHQRIQLRPNRLCWRPHVL